jgi:site-specific recombinase XerD
MDLNQLIEHFLRSGQIAGKNPATTLWYQNRLSGFAEYLRSHGHSLRIPDLTQADAERYIADLMSRTARWENHPHHKPQAGRGLSRSTIQGHTRAIRTLSAWARKQGYLQELRLCPFVQEPRHNSLCCKSVRLLSCPHLKPALARC